VVVVVVVWPAAAKRKDELLEGRYEVVLMFVLPARFDAIEILRRYLAAQVYR